MKRFPGVLVLIAAAARAGVFGVGDVAVVEDTSGEIHSNVDLNVMPEFSLMASGGRFCRDTSLKFMPVFGDNYDGLLTFTPKMLDDLMNVQQGQPVRWTDQGIGEQSYDWGSQFGSAAKLSQCVFMGSLLKLPASPDGPATIFLGLPLGLTGTELMGHEYGHHWLNWTYFDKNDGKGKQDMLRGYDDSSCMGDTTCTGNLNGHYAYDVDSHSVMYGNFITDNHDGTFALTGGARKYNELDQYLMGLRDPSEVSPLMALDDGTHHGSAAGAHGPTGTDTVSGMTRVDVSIDDIVRALGARSPAYPNTQNCWRVAFVLTVPPGESYVPADVQKVDAYRQRFATWFSWATDGRGTMDTRLTGTGCLRATFDGGTDIAAPDAGTTVEPGDAGGDSEVPGRTIIMVPPIDETPMTPMDMKPPPPDDIVTTKLKPGCGCVDTDGLWVLGAFALVLRRRAFKR